MTAPATASPAIMDDEEMMRLFKKFHIVTAGTRALEIIGDPVPSAGSWYRGYGSVVLPVSG